LTARRDAEAGKLVERERARALKGAAGRPIPHDVGTAQEELARLEKFHEAQINKLIEARVGKFSDLESRRETMLRNRARTKGGKTGANYDPLFRNEDAGSGRYLPPREGVAGGVHVPTLKEEARAHVEQELEQAIAKNARHPAVKRITERLSRITSLREDFGRRRTSAMGCAAKPATSPLPKPRSCLATARPERCRSRSVFSAPR
jgi:hypothetical protein